MTIINEDHSLSLRNEIEELREEAATASKQSQENRQASRGLTERIKRLEAQVVKKKF